MISHFGGLLPEVLVIAIGRPGRECVRPQPEPRPRLLTRFANRTIRGVWARRHLHRGITDRAAAVRRADLPRRSDRSDAVGAFTSPALSRCTSFSRVPGCSTGPSRRAPPSSSKDACSSIQPAGRARDRSWLHGSTRRSGLPMTITARTSRTSDKSSRIAATPVYGSSRKSSPATATSPLHPLASSPAFGLSSGREQCARPWCPGR